MRTVHLKTKLLLIGAILSGTSPLLAFAETHTVIQKDKKFSSDALNVKIGDTIVFQNDEKDITHNVYSISTANEFELKTQKPGTKTPVLIDGKNHQEGEMLVECAIHPQMKIKVNIKK